ncbi:MAG: hypothetical protein R8K20_06935 [Gallionellaceae bacterium]
MSRIDDHLKPLDDHDIEVREEHEHSVQREPNTKHLRLFVSGHREQQGYLHSKELGNQSSLHEAAIARARYRTAHELELGEQLAAKFGDEERLDALARERVQAEREERAAFAARIKLERRLADQYAARIEQEEIARAQAVLRAESEELCRLALAEREEQVRLMEAEELAKLTYQHVSEIQGARIRTADEIRRAANIAAQIAEEEQLKSLALERTQSKQAEKEALLARIEAENVLATQFEERIEQGNCERNQQLQLEEQEARLNLAAAEREKLENQLNNAELTKQAYLHEQTLEKTLKATAEEERRTAEFTTRLLDEERLEQLAFARVQAEQAKQQAFNARIAAEQQLTVQLEDRIEQEQAECVQTSKSAALEEQLRLDVAAREALERRLKIEEQAAQAALHEAAIEMAHRRATEEVRRVEDHAVQKAQEARLGSLVRERTQLEQAQRAVHKGKSRLVSVERETSEFPPLNAENYRITSLDSLASAVSRVAQLFNAMGNTLPASLQRYSSAFPILFLFIGAGFFVGIGFWLFDGKPDTTPALAQNQLVISTPQETQTKQAEKAAVDEAKLQVQTDKEIRQLVAQWAGAWSRRDVKVYLSYYADDFKLPEGMHRSDWMSQRKARLRKFRSIKVTPRDLQISYTNKNFARVNFKQDFKGDTYKEIGSHKELNLKKVAGHWRIVDEQS